MKISVSKLGFPPSLLWGYVGVLIFMMGDGLEAAWISPYLIDHGLTLQQAAYVTTGYGVTIAIASWFSGVLVEMFGPRKVMLTGTVIYIIGQIIFISWALPSEHYFLMIITYSVRGFGYPLFAYAFLVWITYRSPQHKLGTAVGWFWFVFVAGMYVFGAYYSSIAIKVLGYIGTLWTALIWVIVGALLAIVANKDIFVKNESHSHKNKWQQLLEGITIVGHEPRVVVACLVRVINSIATYAFPLFLPVYLSEKGITTTTWLNIWGTIFTSNVIFNLIFGWIGDKLGWRTTIRWFGGVGCALFTIDLYFVPQWFGGNVILIAIIGILWGICLAGFVPINALTPSLVGDSHKGAAMSLLNLGAGLCVFIGPGLVGLLHDTIGTRGLMWLIAAIYLSSAFLVHLLKTPEERNIITKEHYAEG